MSENLHCKSHSFLTKWWDLLDLSKQKKLLGVVYICPIGSREGMTNFFFWKSVFVKHPNLHFSQTVIPETHIHWKTCQTHLAVHHLGSLEWLFSLNRKCFLQCLHLIILNAAKSLFTYMVPLTKCCFSFKGGFSWSYAWQNLQLNWNPLTSCWPG